MTVAHSGYACQYAVSLRCEHFTRAPRNHTRMVLVARYDYYVAVYYW